MGFLSGITEKVFGGTDNSSQKAQQQANARSQEWIEKMAALSRGDANALYQQGDYARNTGLNAAMALMGRAMPAQMGMFQEGNIAAQQQLLSGLPQYQNAILGMPVNNQAMQPYRSMLPSSDAYTAQLPDFRQMPLPQAGQQWGAPQPQAQPQMQQGGQPYDQQIMARMLGGIF